MGTKVERKQPKPTALPSRTIRRARLFERFRPSSWFEKGIKTEKIRDPFTGQLRQIIRYKDLDGDKFIDNNEYHSIEDITYHPNGKIAQRVIYFDQPKKGGAYDGIVHSSKTFLYDAMGVQIGKPEKQKEDRGEKMADKLIDNEDMLLDDEAYEAPEFDD